MSDPTPPLNLKRTAKAVARYDAHAATWPKNSSMLPSNEWFLEKDRLAAEVGRAFGLDTRDRNSQETCEANVRPNDPWLRGLLAKYHPAPETKP